MSGFLALTLRSDNFKTRMKQQFYYKAKHAAAANEKDYWKSRRCRYAYAAIRFDFTNRSMFIYLYKPNVV
jgi:hypothetical protein